MNEGSRSASRWAAADDPVPAPGGPAPTIKTIERAALVLTAFSVANPHLTLNELTTFLGTSKATAHRYTKALRAANMLQFNEVTSLYSLSPQVRALASPTRAGLPIISVADAYLEELARQVNETVVLSVWDGDRPTVIRSVDATDHLVRISIRSGARLDPTRSAQGRIFCAYLGDSQASADRRAASPALDQAMREIREHGVCVNTPEVTGVHTIAAPVFDHQSLVAAIALVGAETTIPRSVDHPMAQALVDTALNLSRHLSELAAGPSHEPSDP